MEKSLTVTLIYINLLCQKEITNQITELRQIHVQITTNLYCFAYEDFYWFGVNFLFSTNSLKYLLLYKDLDILDGTAHEQTPAEGIRIHPKK